MDDDPEKPTSPVPSTGFCVLCGSSGVELYGAVCASCLAKKGELVDMPERVELIVCPRCGSRQRGKHWERGPPPGLFHSGDLDRHLRVHLPAKLRDSRWEESSDRTPPGPGVRVFHGTIGLHIGNAEVTGRVTTELKEIHHSCPQCSRREGSYYTANIQFRPALEGGPRRSVGDFKRTSHALWEEFLAQSPRTWREAIAWEEELKEGWDVYLMDTAVAKSMAKSLRQMSGAETKESATLWGIRDGRKTYRVTFLLRFPPIIPGDFFENEGELLRVARLEGEKMRIARSSGAPPLSLPARTVPPGWRLVGGRDHLRKVLVESTEPLRIVDPETGETLPLLGPVPPTLEKGAETTVVRDGENAWIVPPWFLKRRSE